MPVREIVSDGRARMKRAVEILANELKTVRTGRASTGLVENIKADFYGTPTPLKQMAALAVSQPNVIVIRPFDAASVREIEKALKLSLIHISEPTRPY